MRIDCDVKFQGMQLLVSVRNRSHQQYANLGRSMSLQIEVPSDGTVNDIAEMLSKRIGVPENRFRIILCGKVLGGGTSIRSLLLGPQTFVSFFLIGC